MTWKSLTNIVSIVVSILTMALSQSIPREFVYLLDVDPSITLSPRYYSNQNFIGRRVPGYESDRIVCTRAAAEQLKKAHETLKAAGYRFVIYDAYRPQSSVDYFKQWSNNYTDITAKDYYYPTIDKKDLFDLGYIAEKSSHSRGSTFDLTIIPIDQPLMSIEYSKEPLLDGYEVPYLNDGTVNMGSSFDLFHEASHHDSPLIAPEYSAMREILRKSMTNNGFNEYAEEWWHYTMIDEPFPDTYFDFIVPA